jgi:hypothetical protein
MALIIGLWLCNLDRSLTTIDSYVNTVVPEALMASVNNKTALSVKVKPTSNC